MAKEGMVISFSLNTVFITVVLVLSVNYNGVHSAKFGERCGSANLCDGVNLQCWGTCVCAVGYEHTADDDECQEKTELVVPDYFFSSTITLRTNLTAAELDRQRENSIKKQLEQQLHELLKDVIAYNDVTVTSITIVNGNLQAKWTVSLDSESPSFANKTRDEAIGLIKKDLEALGEKYKDTIFHVDTSKQPTVSDSHNNDNTQIGLGIGLGCLAFVIIVLVIVGVVLLRKRRARKSLSTSMPTAVIRKKNSKSTVGAPTISSRGGSSQLDGMEYQYSVFQRNDFQMPSQYSSPAPPSEASSVYAVIDDKHPLQ